METQCPLTYLHIVLHYHIVLEYFDRGAANCCFASLQKFFQTFASLQKNLQTLQTILEHLFCFILHMRAVLLSKMHPLFRYNNQFLSPDAANEITVQLVTSII